MTTYTFWDALIWAMSADRWEHTLYVSFWMYLVLIFLTTIVWGKPLFSILNPKISGFWIRNIAGFSVSIGTTALFMYKFDHYHLFDKLTVFGYILN